MESDQIGGLAKTIESDRWTIEKNFMNSAIGLPVSQLLAANISESPILKKIYLCTVSFVEKNLSSHFKDDLSESKR